LKDDPEYANGPKRFLPAQLTSPSSSSSTSSPSRRAASRFASPTTTPATCAGQGIKSQPREILKAIPGVEYVEMPGADGVLRRRRLLLRDASRAVGRGGSNKADSIMETQADVVVSGCPSCLTQLKAMLAAKGSKIKVMHPWNCWRRATRQAARSRSSHADHAGRGATLDTHEREGVASADSGGSPKWKRRAVG